jgi:hypothetical protein
MWREFRPGDYAKAECRNEASGERMRVVVDSCDDEAGVLFGRLDNEPLLATGLHVGDEIEHHESVALIVIDCGKYHLARSNSGLLRQPCVLLFA